MERMKFEEPELTVSRFAAEDIVTTSSFTLFDGGAGDNLVAALFGALFG